MRASTSIAARPTGPLLRLGFRELSTGSPTRAHVLNLR
uniref:Uncharacterized protein n=1 Tax=Arundo donax TaxID=35708 RepID=A0A0A9EZ99_ARUDO